MTNRVRYYITDNGKEAVVRSVPVTVTSQPQHELMSIAQQQTPAEAKAETSRPVGRIVKVLRKPAAIGRK